MTVTSHTHDRRRFLSLASSFGVGIGALRGDRQAVAETSDAAVARGFGKARSVIVIFAGGGQSQLETWDPKPAAPEQVRGEFDAIQTSAPGTLIGEHMPRIARVCDRLTVVRTMSHDDLDHGSAFYLSMTGRKHPRRSSNPPPSPKDEPAIGAAFKRFVRTNHHPLDQRFIHPAIHINGPALVPILIGPGQFGGYLGRDYDPMTIGDVTSAQRILPDLEPRQDVPTSRTESRRTLLNALERTDGSNRSQLMDDMRVLYHQAFQMLDRSEIRDAFNLDREAESVKFRYGMNRSGQACLLARRLAQAGVPLITVFWNHSNRGQDQTPNATDEYGWDTHNDIFDALKTHLLPRFDLSFSALIEDLDQRGMLDDTLVICMGEFGRAPLVALEPRFAGATPGRKHWASVYSIALAGAGVSRGKIVGKSDRFAAYPDDKSFGPWHVAATIYSSLGIDPSTHFRDLTDRPVQLASGQVIRELY